MNGVRIREFFKDVERVSTKRVSAILDVSRGQRVDISSEVLGAMLMGMSGMKYMKGSAAIHR